MAASPCRLLIIDDELDLLATLVIRFQANGGFEVQTAVDGVDGLAKVEQFKPDLVLLDLAMPRMDGWEVCRRMRENESTRAIPIVVMTAAATKPLEGRARDLGVKKLLIKPFEEIELIGEVLSNCRQSP